MFPAATLRISLSIVAVVALPPVGPASPQEPPSTKSSGDRGYLGLETQPVPQGVDGKGVVVAYVNPHSAAKSMGFEVGDEIRAVNDILISSPEAFRKEIQQQNINSKQRFLIRRSGQEMKIEGRLGSFDKTMAAYQDAVRKEMIGKRLPSPPAALWWSSSSGKWEERADLLESVKGKHAVVFSFDGCPECTSKRYERMSQRKALLDKASPGAPVAFVGLFFRQDLGKDEHLKAAASMFARSPPAFTAGVAFYPAGPPAAAERDRQVLLHNHGTAILDPAGVVRFIQIYRAPEEDFDRAYQEAVKEARDGAAAPNRAPGEEKSASARGSGSP